MADNEQKNSLKMESSESDATGKVVSRRRFTKTGVTGAAVVMSLLNRPALGNAAQCTPSILASYNLSAHPDIVDCQFGCSPDYWKPSNLQHICSWDTEIPATYGRSVIFSTAFNLPDDLRDPEDRFSEALYTQSLEFIINGGLRPSFSEIGLHAVAALLNSQHSVISTAYPFTLADVLMNFFDAYVHYIRSNIDSGLRDKSMLLAFVNKYDIYDDENVVCVLPLDSCSGGNRV